MGIRNMRTLKTARMRSGRWRPGLFLLLFGLLLAGCGEKEQEGKLRSEEGVTPRLSTEQAQRLMDELNELEARVVAEPTNIEFRRALVEKSVDPGRGLVRAAGYGEAPPKAPSSAMAIQAAQQAAYLDACRWLAYILQWEKDPSQPEFGKIKGKLPGAQIVHKVVTPSHQVTLLVEIQRSPVKE